MTDSTLKHLKTASKIALAVFILALVGLGLYSQSKLRLIREDRSSRIMTTDMKIIVVVKGEWRDSIDTIMDKAERRARLVEKHMNTYNPKSELSRFNRAGAGEDVPLHPETIEVLTMASRIYMESNRAFDVTVAPIIHLWKYCAKEEGREPNRADLNIARNRSRWEHIQLFDNYARKSVASAEINLSGIAKGYAIDLAVQSLISDQCSGGMVNMGGDTRCFGKKPTDEPWIVAIRDPFNRGGILCTLHLKDGAVCTSGNYERPVKIKGKRRNHIYDPRTGDPCDGCASATVIARDATTADAWATALSVLGPGGFKLLKDKKIEALLIMGNADKFSIEMTPGFKPYMAYRNEKYKEYFK